MELNPNDPKGKLFVGWDGKLFVGWDRIFGSLNSRRRRKKMGKKGGDEKKERIKREEHEARAKHS